MFSLHVYAYKCLKISLLTFRSYAILQNISLFYDGNQYYGWSTLGRIQGTLLAICRFSLNISA